MKLTTKTESEIKFTVEYHYNNEGGMDHDVFGKECDTIEEVVELLKLANVSQEEDWEIIGRVNFKTTKAK